MPYIFSLIDTCNPSYSWSPSRFEACYLGVVCLEGQLIGGHACQMSKPLESLLLYVVAGVVSLMCSFLIMSRLVLLTALLRHLIYQVVIFLSRLCQGPCMALVCQGGDEDDELSFGFDGDVGVFQERYKLVADIVCLLDSCFNFSVKLSIFS